MGELSKSEINALGKRLSQGSHSDEDLRLLDEFRRSFGPAFQSVVETLQKRSLAPLERPAKSTPSIIAKLQRQGVRNLSEMQDIAGCRIVVTDRVQQDQLCERLKADFANPKIRDRRIEPSHGYRAVHLIVRESAKPIEIQIRTSLQHLWAELSEKAFDVDPEIKYGGGRSETREFLLKISGEIADYELAEANGLTIGDSTDSSIKAPPIDTAYEKSQKDMRDRRDSIVTAIRLYRLVLAGVNVYIDRERLQ